MSKIIKKVIFALIIIALVFVTGVIIKKGNFEDLEGYMYSFAAEIVGNATSGNATSSNATSSNAPSGNATSSNATSNNATSSNANNNNAEEEKEPIKVTNNENKEQSNQSTNTNNNIKEEVEKDTDAIEEEADEDLTYNNSDITDEKIKEIANSDEEQSIIINLDDNVKIRKEIFEAIKGKSKKLTINVGDNQIIFHGQSIVISKDIDASITYNLVNQDAELKEIGQDGVVINFANNGELPGEAIIRIKVTDEIKSVLNMDTILVYHYDEEAKELKQLEDNAMYNEAGYIEFSINHNSKYVFVNEQVVEKEESMTTANEDEVSFLESNKIYVMIIAISVLTIIIVGVILIVDKKTKGKTNTK